LSYGCIIPGRPKTLCQHSLISYMSVILLSSGQRLKKNLLLLKRMLMQSPLCRLLCPCWTCVLGGQGMAWECSVLDECVCKWACCVLWNVHWFFFQVWEGMWYRNSLIMYITNWTGLLCCLLYQGWK
jgi:hypothetical protein